MERNQAVREDLLERHPAQLPDVGWLEIGEAK